MASLAAHEGQFSRSPSGSDPDRVKSATRLLLFCSTSARKHHWGRGTGLKVMDTPPQPASDMAFSTDVPFTEAARTGVTKLLIEEHAPHNPDPVITKAVARAHRWFEDLTTGTANSTAEIAARESITDNYVSNLIHLA